MKLFFVLVLLILHSCGRENRDSKVKHDLGKFIPSTFQPYFWQAVDPEKFLADTLNDPSGVKNRFIFTGNMVDYLNQWITAAHEIVVKETDQTNITKPKLVIYKSKDINAYVTSANFCIDIEMKFSDSNSTKTKEEVGIKLNGEFKSPFVKCYDSKIDAKSIIESILPQKWPTCYKFTGLAGQDQAVEISDSCINDNYLKRIRKEYGSIEKFSMNLTPNIIFISSQLIQEFTEEETLSIIAHELAHYYRGHSLYLKENESFIYQIDQASNPTAKPSETKDKSLRRIARNLKEGLAIDTEYFPAPKGALFHPRIYSYLKFNIGSLISRSCTDQKCRQACYRLQTDIFYNDSQNLLIYFPEQRVDFKSDKNRIFYHKYEQMVEACLLHIKTENIDQFSRQTLKAPTYYLFKADKIDFNSSEVLLEIIQKHSDNLIQYYADYQLEVDNIIEQANKARLGIYTDEQEADDIATEFMYRLGLNNKPLIEVFIKFQEILDARRTTIKPGQRNHQECRQEYEMGFPNFIPIADYIDPHHDACFRAYNIYREQKAHSKQLDNIQVENSKKPDAKLWNELKESIPNLILKTVKN
ncbi:MAG: hypothetical protein CMP10_14455 [Zetaproteobacteria bacterium]|nr:hypothetical protein [Pseudobdellovibrionaceae bacterium]